MSVEAAMEQEQYRLKRLRDMADQRAQRTAALRGNGEPPEVEAPRFWGRWRDILVRDAVLALMVGGMVAGVTFAFETQRDERIADREVRQNLAAELAVKDDLTNIYLVGQDMQGLVLTGRNLTGARLSRADLRDADLGFATLVDAELRQTSLDGAFLRRANLRGADLTGATFIGADVSETELAEAVLNNVDFRDADLSGANLDDAFWSPSSPPQWPEGYAPSPLAPADG